MGQLVRIGNVMQFPPNIFWSDNIPNKGALVAGRDTSQAGPPDKANRWYRVGFNPGASYDDIGTDRARILEGGAISDPSNGGTLGPWGNIQARPTRFVRSTIPAIIGATVDSAGDVYIDDSKAMQATLNGKYGDYVPVGQASTSTTSTGSYIMSGGSQTTGVGRAKRAYELTMLKDGRFFYAMNKHESAGPDSPHTGVIAAGPGLWPPVFGRPADQGLPDGLYLLSVEPADASPEDAAIDLDGDGVPDCIIPASKAYKALVMAAAAGDPGAIEAANALEIEIPRNVSGGIFGELERLFS